MLPRIRPCYALIPLLFVLLPAEAAIQLSGTRAIMTETDQSVSVDAKNVSARPHVVQTWIDGADKTMDTPFFIAPPLSRFDPNTERSLNITRLPSSALPGDRESYFWINVLEIPQQLTSDDNSLTLATHTRIKLFFRPTAILKLPRGPEQLAWEVQRQANECRLAIQNASAYTVNFAGIKVAGEAENYGRTLVAEPLVPTYLPLASCPAAGLQVLPKVVNDYGVIEDWPSLSLPAPVAGEW